MSLHLRLRRGINTSLKASLYYAGWNRRVAGVRVFTYHSVDESGSPLSVTIEELDAQLKELKRLGCRGLTAVEFVERVAGRPGTRGEVLLTFDDGYQNFHTHAAPLLADHGFPATVFVVTDLVGRRPEWLARDRSMIDRFLGGFAFGRDDRSALRRFFTEQAERPLMSWTDLRELVGAGMDVQSHGDRHRFLTTLEAAELRADLSRSRELLRDRLGVAADLICYPYGDCDARVAEIAREVGFQVGLLADYDRVGFSDPLRVGRIALSGRTTRFDLRFALSGALDRHARIRSALTYRGVRSTRSPGHA